MAIAKKYQVLLDALNQDLWSELSDRHNIILEESPDRGYLTYFDGAAYIIEIDIDHLDPASFTHELLHIYLKDQGVRVVWDLKKKIEKKKLEKIFPTSLRVHIGNCLEHVKMLPHFLNMGYSNEDFLSDFHQQILDEEQLKNLKDTYYEEGVPNLLSVILFIDKFISIKASNNQAYSYSFFLEELRVIDPLLYKILLEFWEGWLNFEVGEPQEKYSVLLDTFLGNIKSWKESHEQGLKQNFSNTV